MTHTHRIRLTGDGLARFGEVAAAHVAADIADGGVPGVVALVAAGEEAHVEAHGALAIGGAAVQRDSQFRISATTKPITGALTLALVREGLLALDEPVDRLLPELADRRVLRRMDGPLDETVPAARPVTVRDLLTFTFGFGVLPEMFDVEQDWPVDVAETRLPLATFGSPNPARQADLDPWLAALGSLPLITQPGERWAYNTSAQVLGALASRATGLPIAEAYRTRVPEPPAQQRFPGPGDWWPGPSPKFRQRRTWGSACRSSPRAASRAPTAGTAASAPPGWSTRRGTWRSSC
jgi:CubicO group peptidase (beta-lactamase class C family)